jgi:hypothetical protein
MTELSLVLINVCSGIAKQGYVKNGRASKQWHTLVFHLLEG